MTRRPTHPPAPPILYRGIPYLGVALLLAKRGQELGLLGGRRLETLNVGVLGGACGIERGGGGGNLVGDVRGGGGAKRRGGRAQRSHLLRGGERDEDGMGDDDAIGWVQTR